MTTRQSLFSTVLALLVAAATNVAAAEWIVRSVSGSALVLENKQWVVLNRGDVVVEPFTVRTLRPGKLDLASTDAAIAIAANSAITVSTSDDTVRVELLAGAMTTFVQARTRAVLVSGGTEMNLTSGQADVLLTPNGPEVRTRNGLISVPDAGGGPPTALGPGETMRPASNGQTDTAPSESRPDTNKPESHAGNSDGRSNSQSPSEAGGGGAPSGASGGETTPSSNTGENNSGGNGRGRQ